MITAHASIRGPAIGHRASCRPRIGTCEDRPATDQTASMFHPGLATLIDSMATQRSAPLASDPGPRWRRNSLISRLDHRQRGIHFDRSLCYSSAAVTERARRSPLMSPPHLQPNGSNALGRPSAQPASRYIALEYRPPGSFRSTNALHTGGPRKASQRERPSFHIPRA